MSNAENFIAALGQAEEEQSSEPLLVFFGAESELTRLNSNQPYRGEEGAREFWDEYFSLFQDIRSTFTNTIEAGGSAVLEWEASGHFQNGTPVTYRGVSVIEFRGGEAQRFRSYYDSAVFVAHKAHPV